MPRLTCPLCRGPRPRARKPVCDSCYGDLPLSLYGDLVQGWQRRATAIEEWQETLAGVLAWKRDQNR